MKGPDKYGDPFMLPSTATFPSDIKSTLDLCLYLYRVNRLYGAICSRVVSYFVTDIEFEEAGDKDEQDKLKKCLTETIGIFSKMQQAGMEWAIYGNGFVRCVEPFDRWLWDTRDGQLKVYNLSMFPEHLVKYDWKAMTYNVPDMRAISKLEKGARTPDALRGAPTVDLGFRDKPSASPDRFSVIFLDPRYCELDKAHHSESVQYIYRIPPDMESRIKRGHLHEVNNTPRGLLAAVSQSKDFRFHGGEIFHFRAPSPTGVSDSGWAVPEILWNYDSLYQLQVYRKADFAVAQEFLHPMRFFTPSFGDKMGDSVMTTVMSKWHGTMKSAIAAHRKDPTSIQALPFEAKYQESGGNGKTMVMHDVVEVYLDTLFDGLGFPRELYRGALTVEAIPNAIRMFERHYDWMYQQLNGLLQFVSNTFQRSFNADTISVRLKRPAMAHNAEWMQLRMQLAANGEIPRGDVYPDVGINDPTSAAVRAAEEQQNIARDIGEISAAFEKEKAQGSMADVAMMSAEQSIAGAPEGGGGGGGGGLDYSVDSQADPTMIQQRAQEIAVEWQTMHEQQPNSHREEMRMAEATNSTLYAAAKQELEKLRSAGGAAGRNQATQVLAG